MSTMPRSKTCRPIPLLAMAEKAFLARMKSVLLLAFKSTTTILTPVLLQMAVFLHRICTQYAVVESKQNKTQQN